MCLHPIVQRIDRAVGIIYRRSNERRANRTIVVVPTILIDSIAVVTVVAAVYKAVTVVVRPRLVGGVEKFVGEAADKRPTALRHIDAPKTIARIHTETDKANRAVLKQVLPIGTHPPTIALDIERKRLTANMIALCVELVVRHRATRAHQDCSQETRPTVA